MPKSVAESERLSQKFGQRSGLEEDVPDDAYRGLGRTGKTASQIHFEEIARMW